MKRWVIRRKADGWYSGRMEWEPSIEDAEFHHTDQIVIMSDQEIIPVHVTITEGPGENKFWQFPRSPNAPITSSEGPDPVRALVDALAKELEVGDSRCSNEYEQGCESGRREAASRIRALLSSTVEPSLRDRIHEVFSIGPEEMFPLGTKPVPAACREARVVVDKEPFKYEAHDTPFHIEPAPNALRRLQAEQVPWIKHNFGDRPSWMPLLGAVEELGELAHAHLKQAQGIRVSEDHDAKAKDAIADVVIFLADYCTARGFDLESLVMETWDKVKLRDWKANPADAYAALAPRGEGGGKPDTDPYHDPTVIEMLDRRDAQMGEKPAPAAPKRVEREVEPCGNCGHVHTVGDPCPLDDTVVADGSEEVTDEHA